MVSGSLALLYFLLSFHGGRQGSGPDRGRSPVKWGDFPFVRPFIRLSVCSFVRPSIRLYVHSPPQAWLAGPQTWLAGPQAWLADPEGGTDKHTDERTNAQKVKIVGIALVMAVLPLFNSMGVSNKMSVFFFLKRPE